MQNRRRYLRVVVERDVVLRHQGRLIPAKIFNMSQGGVFMVADSGDVSSDLPVEVIFDIDGQRRDVSFTGRIKHLERWESESKFGVEFTSVFSKGQGIIQEFLSLPNSSPSCE